jgi:dolichol kinase
VVRAVNFLRTKGFHGIGLIAAAVHAAGGRWFAVGVLTAGAVVQTVLEVRRRSDGAPGPSGAWWTWVGCWGVAVAVPAPDIARAAFLFSAVSDPVGEWVGRTVGHLRIGDKSVEGTLAVFLSAWALGTLCLTGGSVGEPLWGAVAVAGVEAFSTRWNDNVTVPLAGGAVLTALRFWS